MSYLVKPMTTEGQQKKPRAVPRWVEVVRGDIGRLFMELREAAESIEAGAEKRIEKQERTLATADADGRKLEERILFWFAEAIPRVLRYSLVVSIFTAIEASLAAICDELRSIWGLSLDLRDLKDRGIRRSRAYLVKVAGIDIAELDPLWQQLQDWERVRHSITHVNGDIARTHESRALRKAMERLEGVSSEGDASSLGGEIALEFGACLRLLQLGQSYVEGVMEKAFGPSEPLVIERVVLRD